VALAPEVDRWLAAPRLRSKLALPNVPCAKIVAGYTGRLRESVGSEELPGDDISDPALPFGERPAPLNDE